MNFLAVHADLGRRPDADANLAPLHGDNGEANVPIDHDLLAGPARKDEHGPSSRGALIPTGWYLHETARVTALRVSFSFPYDERNLRKETWNADFSFRC